MLLRTSPVSSEWGFDRGTPIDRLYIDGFISDNRRDIRGRVVEVRDTRYAARYGMGITRQDVLDIDVANPAATVVADLSHAGHVEDASFDCFILTQVLQYVSDPAAALRHIHRMLAPGGVLLATVPSIIRVDEDGPDRWRFTRRSCQELFADVFGPDRIQVGSHGNLLAATAFLSGLAVEELSKARIVRNDPRYPVVLTVRAAKSIASK